MTIKLPRTLHIEGSRQPVGHSTPDDVQFKTLDGQFLVIEEKVDGTGVSIHLDKRWNIHINHRGHSVQGKEFKMLRQWAENHWEELLFTLGERYILFGEWMYNKHTIFYDNLPHFFLESDIYDQERGIWLSTNARNNLLREYSFIKSVPVIAALKPSALWQITSCVGKSKFQTEKWQTILQQKCLAMAVPFHKTLAETDSSGLMEGLYIKHEDDFQVVNRYKYVRYEFLQTILNSGSHLIDRIPIYNSLKGEIFSYSVDE